MPVILFPSEPFSPSNVDSDFEQERTAARRVDLPTALIDHTGILKGDPIEAVSRIPEAPGTAMYRGWMLKPTQYAAMHEALLARGIRLINNSESYRACHCLPDSYPFIESCTPRSVWLPVHGAVDFDAVFHLLASFGSSPIIVKDYVKSQKHYWTEACFIPAADNQAAVRRVVARFIELQGDDLNEGLVFREFVPLKVVGTHPKSGMPLAAEFRTFWFRGEPILVHRYWGDLTTFNADFQVDALRPIAARIPSQFFTMDVALKENGDWTIVELGDGQVAGLPSPDLAPGFFQRIAAALNADEPA